MTLLLYVIAGFLYDFARKYLVSRLSLTVFYSFSFPFFIFLRRFEDK